MEDLTPGSPPEPQEGDGWLNTDTSIFYRFINGAWVESEPPKLCGRCYAEMDELFPANCQEKPELLRGAPIGMYHCPDCGVMILAGVPHPDLCKLCLDRQNPSFD